jgi:hypothetical protein
MNKIFFVVLGMFIFLSSSDVFGNDKLSQKALDSIGQFLILDFESTNGKYKPLSNYFLVKKINNVETISDEDINLDGVKGILLKGKYQKIEIINEISEIGMVVRYAYIFNDTKVFWSDPSNSLLQFQLRPELGNTGVLRLLEHTQNSIIGILKDCQKSELPMKWTPSKEEIDFYIRSIMSFWEVFINRVGIY